MVRMARRARARHSGRGRGLDRWRAAARTRRVARAPSGGGATLMSDAAALTDDLDPYRVGHGGPAAAEHLATGHGEGGPASKWVIVGYGFWIFLLSDIVMFSCFFAAHAVL